MIQEFKDFINKGGVFEAAVGLVMALAFIPVVDSLVGDVIMQIVAGVFGQPDFSSIGFDIGDARVGIGSLINAIIGFTIVGFIVFLLVKAYNSATGAGAEEDGPSEVDLLTEIRDQLARR